MKHPKRHIHAESMLLYAQGCMDSEEEYLNWEVRSPGVYWWEGCFDIPNWSPNREYRRKPPEPKWEWGFLDSDEEYFKLSLTDGTFFCLSRDVVNSSQAGRLVEVLNTPERPHEQ